jgi:hypothetical protein
LRVRGYVSGTHSARAAAFLTSTEKGGARGNFTEPAEDLTTKRLLASLAGHVAGYLAAIK